MRKEFEMTKEQLETLMGADISHEEIGFACDWCGNSGAMCGCKPCKVCKDKYAPEDMPLGLCPDCDDNFNAEDLETRLEIAMDL